MREVIVKLYQFEELNDKAKEKARDWYREGLDVRFEAECLEEEFKRLCGLFGLNIKDINYSGFYSQGDGACFNGNYSYKKGGLEALKSDPFYIELVPIAEALEEAQKKCGYELTASLTHTNHRYSHEYTVSIDVSHNTEELNYSCYGEQAEEVKEAMRDIMRLFYKKLTEAWEYLHSNRSIDENITINEYEFLASGERY